MKKSFSLLELIVVIAILSFTLSFFQYNKNDNSLNELVNRMVIYLKQTRHNAMIDSKENESDPLWHKQRWTLKFFRCNKNVGGVYYVIYSDRNKKGHPSFDESLKDPLTKKRVYSTNSCQVHKDRSKYVLLTKEYQIESVDVSCNSTNSLGQISFGSNGKVFSKLSSYEYESELYEIKQRCFIKFTNKENKSKTIAIEPRTGYIWAM